MAVYLTTETRNQIFKEHSGNEKNTGHVEGQIALFTHRVNGLSAHLKDNIKDHSSRRTLLTLVGKRKRLLKYLMHIDINRYRAIIEKLGLRK